MEEGGEGSRDSGHTRCWGEGSRKRRRYERSRKCRERGGLTNNGGVEWRMASGRDEPVERLATRCGDEFSMGGGARFDRELGIGEVGGC